MGLLPLIGLLNTWLLSVRGGTRVTASTHGIAIEERSAWRARSSCIPTGKGAHTAAPLAAAGFRNAGSPLPATGPRPGHGWIASPRRPGPSRGIVVKSRNELRPIGAGLADDELRYLLALLTRALSPTPGW